jgi:hypothetical protein
MPPSFRHLRLKYSTERLQERLSRQDFYLPLFGKEGKGRFCESENPILQKENLPDLGDLCPRILLFESEFYPAEPPSSRSFSPFVFFAFFVVKFFSRSLAAWRLCAEIVLVSRARIDTNHDHVPRRSRLSAAKHCKR